VSDKGSLTAARYTRLERRRESCRKTRDSAVLAVAPTAAEDGGLRPPRIGRR